MLWKSILRNPLLMQTEKRIPPFKSNIDKNQRVQYFHISHWLITITPFISLILSSKGTITSWWNSAAKWRNEVHDRRRTLPSPRKVNALLSGFKSSAQNGGAVRQPGPGRTGEKPGPAAPGGGSQNRGPSLGECGQNWGCRTAKPGRDPASGPRALVRPWVGPWLGPRGSETDSWGEGEAESRLLFAARASSADLELLRLATVTASPHPPPSHPSSLHRHPRARLSTMISQPPPTV